VPRLPLQRPPTRSLGGVHNGGGHSLYVSLTGSAIGHEVANHWVDAATGGPEPVAINTPPVTPPCLNSSD
jgi:hypothetical protein